jgi:Kef-type K+ transport system membrane component KefB
VQKLVLMSVLIATFWVPMAYANSPSIRRSVRKMRKTFAIFCVSYVIGIVYIMPRL